MIKEKSFRARWSEALSKEGMTPISNVFLEKYHLLRITPAESMFIIHCFKFKWTVDFPYPSLNTIAKQMGKDRNTVQTYVRSLERKGYVTRNYAIGQPSKLDFSNLIKILEDIAPYPNLDRGTVEILVKPYRKSDTKEEPSIKTI